MTSGPSDSSEFDSTGDRHRAESDDAYIRRLEELERDFHDLDARLGRLLEPRLRILAGPHLDTMVRSQEETLKYITDVDPGIREAAVELSYQKWQNTDMFTPVYENLATSDPNYRVRSTAIRALGTCYRKTKDARIGHLLATIVRNNELTDDIRLTAFTSLLRLHGNFDYAGRSPLVPAFLDEIDWPFVDQYYNRS